VLANDFVESLGRESRAQQVIRGFHRGFVRRFAYAPKLPTQRKKYLSCLCLSK
jgi:hypothetical protein